MPTIDRPTCTALTALTALIARAARVDHPKFRSHAARGSRGFTLIELMIVVAIAGVLGSIAMPSFEAPLHKARRSDVLVATMQVQAAQERLRGNTARYGSLAELGVAPVTPNGHYRLALDDTTADGYVLLATATGAQARDAACRHMKLTSTQLNLAHASGPDAGVANPDLANRKCWNL
jgi:type IV pilus assembly protein PilE